MSQALVIGLDGLPLTLMHELAGDGTMPRVAELLGQGRTAELRAPVPEISSTSWATFLTGADPGRHGIYGFTDLRPDSYDVFFPNFTHLQAPAIWEHAAARGLTTICLNVPGTYPAPSIRGAVVSGFVAPTLEHAVQPVRLLESLRRLGYQVDVEIGNAAADPRGFLERLVTALHARVRTFTHLLARESWDIAITVITETDRLQHFLWNHVTDPHSDLHGPVRQFYGEVDDAVGRLLDRADGQTDIFLISDHGFGAASCQFHVNAWLRAQGWLPALTVTPSLAALDGSARVFALDPGRFYLHRKDRFPCGSLTPAQTDELADELVEALGALRWQPGAVGPAVDGPLLLSEVCRQREIYHGPLSDQAPDVVAVPAPGVQLRGAWRSQDVTAPDVLTGTHTRGNAVFWTSRDDVGAEHVEMADVAPTVLASAGAATSGLDGRDLRGTPAARRVPTHERRR